jgi:hypothetical protein
MGFSVTSVPRTSAGEWVVPGITTETEDTELLVDFLDEALQVTCRFAPKHNLAAAVNQFPEGNKDNLEIPAGGLPAENPGEETTAGDDLNHRWMTTRRPKGLSR